LPVEHASKYVCEGWSPAGQVSLSGPLWDSGTDSLRGRLQGQEGTATLSVVPKPPQPPLIVWEGVPSGEKFAALLRARAEQLDVAVQVEVQPWAELPGAFGVFVDWGPDPETDSATYEVADWVDGARVLDTGDDVTLADALDYLSVRLSGAPPKEALDRVVPPRPSLWSRLRRRATGT
jgi:hypothetical protein